MFLKPPGTYLLQTVKKHRDILHDLLNKSSKSTGDLSIMSLWFQRVHTFFGSPSFLYLPIKSLGSPNWVPIQSPLSPFRVPLKTFKSLRVPFKSVFRGWGSKFATRLNIKIDIVQKVYEWLSCPFAKMIPPWGNQFDKISDWSQIKLLKYGFFKIYPSRKFASSPST